MFLTVHAAGAMIIGKEIDSSLLALVLGFVSHLILDMIPHGDEHLVDKNDPQRLKKLTLIGLADLSGVVIITWLFWQVGLIPLSLPVIMCVIGSLIPDFIWSAYEVTKIKWLGAIAHKLDIWFHKFFGLEISFKKGLIVQVITLGLFILILSL